MTEEKLLTPDQVATRLQVDVQTVRAWLRQKRLKGYFIGRVWRISEEQLRAFLEGRQEKPAKRARQWKNRKSKR